MKKDVIMENNNKEKKSIIDKIKGIGVLVLAFGIGEVVRIIDGKWFLLGFVLLLVVLFAISVFLTIRNKIIKSNDKNSNIDEEPHQL